MLATVNGIGLAYSDTGEGAPVLLLVAERPDSSSTLPSISVPTLVIVGEQDVLTPPDDAQFIAGRVPGARLATIEQAGHMSNLENPEAFNDGLLAFLRELR